MDITVTITIEPSFMGTREYTLKWDDHENEYVMLVRKWKTSNPHGEPDVERKTVLPHSKAHSVLWRLDRAELKIYPDGDWGCDGTTYTLEISKNVNSVTFCWWCDLPEQWKALQEVVDFVKKHDTHEGEDHDY